MRLACSTARVHMGWVLFSWLGLVGSAAAILLSIWLLLYLLSLRTQYSLQGKHILVRILAEGVAALLAHAYNSFGFQITGGSSGIGKAVAKESLKRGAAVVTILARNKVWLSCWKQDPKCEYSVNGISCRKS